MPALYAIGTLLALAWLAITLWALLYDRSRGRPRCPKCFFSLEGLHAELCPECGRRVVDEPSRYRTRRRWGLALLCTFLVLPPAALTSGLARTKQAGAWADMPTGALVRLLWLGDEALEQEIIGRVRGGELARADAERLVRYAAGALGRDARRDRAYALLEAVARNSYVITNDRPDALRPMLEELAVDRTVPALLARMEAGDASERARVLVLLSHLRDADERANLQIIASLADDDPEASAGARKAIARSWHSGEIIRRLPNPPRWLMRLDPSDTGAAQWLGQEIRTRAADRPGVTAFARALATGRVTPPPEITTDAASAQAFGLWLWCRLDRGSGECWESVKQAARSESDALREAAFDQATTFPWSDDLAALLRAGLRDPSFQVQSAAVESAAAFGTTASELVPDFLEFAASDRRGANSAFPEDFAAIGGEPRDLLGAITDRLERAKIRLVSDSDAPDNWIHPDMDFTWIASLGLRDEAAAEIVNWFIENRIDLRYQPYSDVANAVVAYAVLTGDADYATTVALSREPDFSSGLIAGSWAYAVFGLCRRGLSNEEMIVETLVTRGDAMQRSGFLQIAGLLPKERLARFKPALELLAADADDPAIAAAATTQLKRLD